MTQELFNNKLPGYLDGLVPERPAEMQAMEAYALEHNFPIIGPAAGYYCYSVAKMIKAVNVYELGSGYGYSTAWFAKAVQENGGGKVHHVVWDEELSAMAKNHLGKLGYGDMIEYTVGEAVQALKDTPGPFDLIFNDIHKDGYAASLPVIEEKLRPGGVLIIDNMLWSGKIFDPDITDPNTEGVRETTRILTTGDSWISTLIPIRDGLIIAQKR